MYPTTTTTTTACPPTNASQSNLGNAKTDGFDTDMGFTGNEYSLLLLLFYIPNAVFDLPLNLLTKKFSGRIVLSSLCVGWGAMSMLQVACKNFAGMLAVRLMLGHVCSGSNLREGKGG